MKRKSALFAAAAALAAFAFSARAQTRVDFDQGGPDAKLTISDIRLSVKQSPSAELPPAGAVKTGLAAVSPDQVKRRIIVFKKGTPAQQQMSIAQVGGATVVNKLKLINALAVVVPNAQLHDLDAGLAASPEVVRVEEDFYQNWLAADEPPPQQDAQTVPWGIARVNAKGAWHLTRGAGVKVAVVDTGIDYEHPDLKVAGGFSIVTHDDKYKDDNGHGTHVSGTIAAQDNGVGVVGVAPEVALFGVKVLDAGGSGTFADVIEGIQWAADNKMDVANFSLGASQGTQALEDAVKAAAKAGLTIIAAAGNSGGAVGYPAAYEDVIAISASNSKDKLAYFSSRGPQVAIIAPGVAVQSTYMGGGYRSLDGTSMACPHAVGLAALAVAAQGIHGSKALRTALQKAATPLPGLTPDQQGAGLVDAAKLVAAE
ncbi:MAG: S8 family peptidase [Elusimicrobia bacterium]|nr:S8 family peptidase [Elusimicrobiota bacterium]